MGMPINLSKVAAELAKFDPDSKEQYIGIKTENRVTTIKVFDSLEKMKNEGYEKASLEQIAKLSTLLCDHLSLYPQLTELPTCVHLQKVVESIHNKNVEKWSQAKESAGVFKSIVMKAKTSSHDRAINLLRAQNERLPVIMKTMIEGSKMHPNTLVKFSKGEYIPLWRAAIRLGDWNAVQKFIKIMSEEEIDVHGLMALNEARKRGEDSEEKLFKLLQERRPNCRTSQHAAIRLGQWDEVIKHLKTMRPEELEQFGPIAWEEAEKKGQADEDELFRLLLTFRPECPIAFSLEGERVLKMPVWHLLITTDSKNHLEQLEEVIKRPNIDLLTKNADGDDALDIAFKNGRYAEAEILMKSNAFGSAIKEKILKFENWMENNKEKIEELKEFEIKEGRNPPEHAKILEMLREHPHSP